MATMSPAARTGVQVVLVLVILGLAYGLYVSITAPWEAVERRQELTRQTRARMSDIRTALIRYERAYDRFPLTLDSLVAFVRTDSATAALADSLFGEGFDPGALPFSPRTGRPFAYAVTDTTRVKTYLLKDPDSNDQIGALGGDPARLNAASWE